MIDTKKLIAQINVPAKDQAAYKKTCIAGMKLMFYPQSHQLMIDALNKPLPMDKKLAQGITELMVLMFKKSNGTMQPQAVIPAATYLLLQAIDFLQKAGQEITDQVMSSALKQLITAIMAVFGGHSPDKFQSAINGAGGVVPTAPVTAGAAVTQPATNQNGLLGSR